MEKHEVAIRLITPMLGTVPKDKEVYATFIESKKPEDAPDKETETVEEIEEKGWTGFHQDENGLFVYDYLVKGFLRYAGNVLKDDLEVKALKSKLTDFLFVFPRRVYLGKIKPDGVLERPLRAQTMQGPRVTLARSDYIAEGTEITFEIGILKHKEITVKLVRQLLDYGALQGLGQFRNGGYGRFEVVRFE
jgi:hypothetical protein